MTKTIIDKWAFIWTNHISITILLTHVVAQNLTTIFNLDGEQQGSLG